jgi:hypothetical protein
MALKLADIKAKAAASSGGNFDGESPFIKLADGNKLKIHFLQEADEDSALYNERRGTVRFVDEHTGLGSEGYKRRALCTTEQDGRCWACEQRNAGGELAKKWKPKMRFYANVLVRGVKGPDGTVGEDKVKILAQGFGDKAVGNKMLNIAEEFEQLGGKDCSLSRKGKGMNDTSYDLLPLAPKELTKDEQELELIDLDKFIKYVPYDQQSAFYAGQDIDESGEASDWTE